MRHFSPVFHHLGEKSITSADTMLLSSRRTTLPGPCGSHQVLTGPCGSCRAGPARAARGRDRTARLMAGTERRGDGGGNNPATRWRSGEHEEKNARFLAIIWSRNVKMVTALVFSCGTHDMRVPVHTSTIYFGSGLRCTAVR